VAENVGDDDRDDDDPVAAGLDDVPVEAPHAVSTTATTARTR
jgi:hypothetical protein